MKDPSEIPEDELGVELDRAIDHRLEAQDAIYRLRRAHVEVDGAADSMELPTDATMEMREVQDRIDDTVSILNDEVEAAKEYQSGIEDRLQD